MQTYEEIDVLFDDMMDSVEKIKVFYKNGKISDEHMDAFLTVFLSKLQSLIEVTIDD